ncbi:MAG: Na/Pi cotransporter family protein [Planctomycetota bacterium]
MVKEMIFGIVGGLGLFLFGMGIMSNGLKEIAGQKLKDVLGALTKHRLIAALMGALVTCLVQSSSATTVMIVGFVNAGLLSLRQALCVILGVNVGTTFTAWMVSILGIGGLKITAYALPAIGVGFLLQVIGKTQKIKSIGSILLGFGILFVGISFMKNAFDPFKDNQAVQSALIQLIQNPILAALIGMLITALLQSSSATIMIVQVMAFQGAFGTDWEIALRITLPFILGANIGTTITAQLAAIQTSRNSRRAAMGHTLINTVDVFYILPLMWIGVYHKIVMWVSPWELSQSTIMVHMAIGHSLINTVDMFLLLPFVRWMEWVVTKILPFKKEELAQKPVVLEKHLLNTPVIALEQTKREIIRMARTAKKALRFSISGIVDDNRKELGSVREIEDFIDVLQLEITSYLSALSRRQLSDEVSIELPVLLHTVNDLERIGDHAVNIVEIAERKIEQKLSFSNSALTEAEQLRKEIDQMFDNVIAALENNDVEAAKSAVLTNENNLNKMQMDFRRSHVQRMSEGICTPQTGLIFIDLVDNIEKIGDHLTNIAQAIIGGLHWEGVKPKVTDIL